MRKLDKAFTQRMRGVNTRDTLAELVNFVRVTFGTILDHVTKIRIPVGSLKPREIAFEPCFHDHLPLTGQSAAEGDQIFPCVQFREPLIFIGAAPLTTISWHATRSVACGRLRACRDHGDSPRRAEKRSAFHQRRITLRSPYAGSSMRSLRRLRGSPPLSVEEW